MKLPVCLLGVVLGGAFAMGCAPELSNEAAQVPGTAQLTSAEPRRPLDTSDPWAKKPKSDGPKEKLDTADPWAKEAPVPAPQTWGSGSAQLESAPAQR